MLTWVRSTVATLKSARTRTAARARKRVVVKRVEYIVEVFCGVKGEGGKREGMTFAKARCAEEMEN